MRLLGFAKGAWATCLLTLGVVLNGPSLAMAAPSALPAPPSTGRFAIVVGHNQGSEERRSLQHAARDARKIADVLTTLGGVPRSQLTLLTDRSAAEFRRALAEVDERIAAFKDRTGRPAVLVVYYSGHASRTALELGPTVLPFAELRGYLKSASADVRVVFIDACQSGQLIATKGGRWVDRVHIASEADGSARGQVVITSSGRDELSQESDELRGAVFSHYLASALRGAADTGDGKVTLREAYDYVYRNTVADTSTTIVGAQHPMYDLQLEGQGEVVLTRLPRTGPIVHVELPPRGRLVVLDAARERTLLELRLDTPHVPPVALDADRYEVFWLDGKRVLRAQVDITRGQEVRLRPQDFELATLTETVAKGGLYHSDQEASSTRVQLAWLGRTWPLADGISPSWGAVLGLRIPLAERFFALGRIYGSAHADRGNSSGYVDVGIGVGAGYVVHARPPRVWLGPMIAYEHLFQDSYAGRARHSPGAAYTLLGGLDFDVWEVPVHVAIGAEGRALKVADGTVRHRLGFQVTLGSSLSL